MYVYNISGGVANIVYQSCAQIDNNQQVYEAQIQVPRCNSILKAGSHECQKLRKFIVIDVRVSTQTTVPMQFILMSMLSSVWARSCIWIGVSIPHQIFPHLLFWFTLLYFLFFQRLHTSDNDQITYLGLTFVLKKE
jgi:hypothetical protein